MNGQTSYYDGYSSAVPANQINPATTNNNNNYGYVPDPIPNNNMYDGGPFPGSSRREVFDDAAYYDNNTNYNAPRSNSLAGSNFHVNFLSKKKKNASNIDFTDGDDGDDKDVAMPANTAAKNMKLNDITHIRDRGRYGGFDTLDTAPIIPTLETPVETLNKKTASSTQYRKAMTLQKKQMMSNIAKMNNSYQHNHNLLNPIGSDPPASHSNSLSNNPRADSFSTGAAFASDPFAVVGGPTTGPRSMSLATGSAQRFPPRQMPMRGPGPNGPSFGPGPGMGGPNRSNFSQANGQPPRSMSFTNNPNPGAPRMMRPNGNGGPPGSRPSQQRPLMNNDPRAMSLQSGRLPPFAPKPIGAMGAMGGPPMPQPMGPGSRNNSFSNLQNPMGTGGPGSNSRNGSLPNMQNPMGGAAGFPPRNGSMTNMQNPMNGAGALRSGSMTNLPNPMNGVPPRNGNMTNMQNPMGGPRMNSLTNQSGPGQNGFGGPGGPGGPTGPVPRFNSLPGGPNPRFMNHSNNNSNNSLQSNQSALKLNNGNNLSEPLFPYNNNANSIPSFNGSTSDELAPAPPTKNAAFDRTKTPSPKTIAAELHGSPTRLDSYNNSPVRHSPLKNSSTNSNSNSGSPRRTPFETIDEPIPEAIPIDGGFNNNSSNTPKTPKLHGYQRSSLSNEVFKNTDDNFDLSKSPTIKEEPSFFDDSGIGRKLGMGNTSLNDEFNPYSNISKKIPLNDASEGNNSSQKKPLYDLEDNYLDTNGNVNDFGDDSDDNDLNYSAFDKVTKQSMPNNNKPEQSLTNSRGLNNDNAVDSNSVQNESKLVGPAIASKEMKPTFNGASASANGTGKKPLRRKPPTASPIGGQAQFDNIDNPYESKSALNFNSRGSFSNNNVNVNDYESPSKTQQKKDNFMAKLEASIDDSIGAIDVNLEDSNYLNTSDNKNNGKLNGKDDPYGLDSHRISASNFNSINPASPNLGDNLNHNGFKNGNGMRNGEAITDANSQQQGNGGRLLFNHQNSFNSNNNNSNSFDKKSSISTASNDSSFNTYNNSNSGKENTNSSSRNSGGIAGGFLKKLGLKKKSSIHKDAKKQSKNGNNNSSGNSNNNRNSKRESKSNFVMVKPSNKNRGSFSGPTTFTNSNGNDNVNNNDNAADSKFDSLNSTLNALYPLQANNQNAVLDNKEASYNHGMFDLEEGKAALFAKPKPQSQSQQQQPLKTLRPLQDLDELNNTDGIYKRFHNEISHNDNNSNVTSANGERMLAADQQQEQPTDDANVKAKSKHTNEYGKQYVLENDSFGDSLSGAFDDIGHKIDEEFYKKEANDQDGKITKDQELEAKAEVENEFMKMKMSGDAASASHANANGEIDSNSHLLKHLSLNDNSSRKVITKLVAGGSGTENHDGDGKSKAISGAGIATAAGAVSQSAITKQNQKKKNAVSPTEKLNLTVEQLGIIEANQSLINELQLMTKELTDSIQREVKLENDLRNYKLNINPTIDTSDYETMDKEIRDKSLIISKLMNELNEERRKRNIAEEHVLLWEKNAEETPSALQLNYEKLHLESELINKQELINQQQQLIYQFDSEKLKFKEDYSKFESENLNYKKKIIPDLQNEIELLRNHDMQSGKKFQEKAEKLQLENRQLKLELKEFKQNNLVENQRDALRDALKSLKEQKDKEIRQANEKISQMDLRIQKLSDLNEKLQNKLLLG